MNTPSSSSRVVLLADRRVPTAGRDLWVRRYRLARVTHLRPGETGRPPVESKRS